MKQIYEKILNEIPDYKVFLTPDELDQNSRELAERYPETVELFTMGKTRAGKDLLCLKIGNGSQNALMFGCPHPNEPIGTMMLEYFSEELAKNQELREELDYTWYIVKAWDRDGLELNNGWLKGPYTVYQYSRHFFRPAGHQQVDWTFPIDYKEMHFHDVLPESEAMMKLIDQIKPKFIYSLHNAGFGGVYWYITHPLSEDCYAQMRKAAERMEIPLHLGEPEVPYLKSIAPAVYPCLSIKSDYDYEEKYGSGNPTDAIKCGECSANYAMDHYDSFTLLTELPYFFDPRISDLTPTEDIRKETVIKRLDRSDKDSAYIRSVLEATKEITQENSPFRLALEAFSREGMNDGTRVMIEQNPDYARNSTVAENFDSLLLSPFYSSLSYGMAIRLCEYELEDEERGSKLSAEEKDTLEKIKEDAIRAHKELSDELEEKLDYQVIPIRKLISIQLECGLAVLEELKNK